MPDKDINRRKFIKLAAMGTGVAGLGTAAPAAILNDGSGKPPKLSDHEALAYEKLDAKRIRCTLCPRECEVADRERGYCGVRENQGGTYKTLVYSRPCAVHIDPIEKKPLFHFLPGERALSIATAGCNVECQFCQNWRISQFRPEQVDSVYAPPKEIARAAAESQSKAIAYTYSEPVIFYEYALDCAREGNKKGVKSVFISNGYINPDPMRELCKELSAVKVDLKAFTESFYEKYVRGELDPVLRTLELLAEQGMHTEIVVLLIPGLNDGPDEIREMSAWIKKNLGPDVPLHFTRFYPTYRMKNLSRTPISTLETARDVAVAEGLNFVYVGNVPGHKHESTYCPGCGERIIYRYGHKILKNRVSGGKCENCGTEIPGVWTS